MHEKAGIGKTAAKHAQSGKNGCRLLKAVFLLVFSRDQK
jgi:hypothetical protein